MAKRKRNSLVYDALDSLIPFFENNFFESHVQAYAKLIGVSAPTASTLLEYYKDHDVLNMRVGEEYEYTLSKHLYSPKKTTSFCKLNNLYWANKIYESGLQNKLEQEYQPDAILLLAPITTAQLTEHSPLKLGLKNSKKPFIHNHFYHTLKREIQVKPLSDLEIVELENFYSL